MKGVLKASSLPLGVQSVSLVAVREAVADPQAQDRSGRDKRETEHKERTIASELAAVRKELADEKSKMVDRLKQEFERGKTTGAADQDRANVLLSEALDGIAAKAREQWSDQLAHLDGLAIAVSRAVLNKMIANPDWRAELVEQSVAAMLQRLSADSVLGIELSLDDFPEAPLLEGRTFSVKTSPSLAGGECRIELTSGERDIGPVSQWQEASMLLDELAAEAGLPC